MPKARERRLREARSGCPGDGVAQKDHPSRKGGGTDDGVDDDCSSGPAEALRGRGRLCGGQDVEARGGRVPSRQAGGAPARGEDAPRRPPLPGKCGGTTELAERDAGCLAQSGRSRWSLGGGSRAGYWKGP